MAFHGHGRGTGDGLEKRWGEWSAAYSEARGGNRGDAQRKGGGAQTPDLPRAEEWTRHSAPLYALPTPDPAPSRLQGQAAKLGKEGQLVGDGLATVGGNPSGHGMGGEARSGEGACPGSGLDVGGGGGGGQGGGGRAHRHGYGHGIRALFNHLIHPRGSESKGGDALSPGVAQETGAALQHRQLEQAGPSQSTEAAREPQRTVSLSALPEALGAKFRCEGHGYILGFNMLMPRTLAHQPSSHPLFSVGSYQAGWSAVKVVAKTSRRGATPFLSSPTASLLSSWRVEVHPAERTVRVVSRPSNLSWMRRVPIKVGLDLHWGSPFKWKFHWLLQSPFNYLPRTDIPPDSLTSEYLKKSSVATLVRPKLQLPMWPGCDLAARTKIEYNHHIQDRVHNDYVHSGDAMLRWRKVDHGQLHVGVEKVEAIFGLN